MPDCWQETTPQVDYALALVQVILGKTLPASVEKNWRGCCTIWSGC